MKMEVMLVTMARVIFMMMLYKVLYFTPLVVNLCYPCLYSYLSVWGE